MPSLRDVSVVVKVSNCPFRVTQVDWTVTKPPQCGLNLITYVLSLSVVLLRLFYLPCGKMSHFLRSTDVTLPSTKAATATTPPSAEAAVTAAAMQIANPAKPLWPRIGHYSLLPSNIHQRPSYITLNSIVAFPVAPSPTEVATAATAMPIVNALMLHLVALRQWPSWSLLNSMITIPVVPSPTKAVATTATTLIANATNTSRPQPGCYSLLSTLHQRPSYNSLSSTVAVPALPSSLHGDTPRATPSTPGPNPNPKRFAHKGRLYARTWLRVIVACPH